ncbi:MAG: flagellar hook-length control protein FliK [Thiobacillus sp.]
MNATPMNISPANTAQAQPAASKQQDSAAPDVPFSQVLSSEMAQNRRRSNEPKPGNGADADAGPDAASQATRQTEANTRDTAKTTETEDTPGDPLAVPVAEGAPTVPATLLGQAITPDQLKLATAKADGLDAAEPSAKDAGTLLFQNSGKGRTPRAVQAGQLADPARDAQKTDPALTGKATTQTASLASAFSGQLAAARQTDGMKTNELVSDLMSNPAMRPASQASFETLHTLNEVASPKLTPTLGTTAWTQALGEKVVWMAAGAQQSATLTLNPPNMGPLQIVLNLSNEQATASFFSAQPDVRHALEAAFPRLKEMMNEAGIQLQQATVSADTPRQNDTPERQEQRIATPFSGTDNGVTAGLQPVHAPVLQSGRGLIDTFA